LAANIPAYAGTAQDWMTQAQNSLQRFLPTLKLPTYGVSSGHIGATQTSSFINGAVASLGAIALNTATGFFIAFSSIVLSVFFLLNDKQIAEGFTAMFPSRKRQTARKLAAEVTQVFGSYISGQVLVSLLTGAVIATATAVIGFKFSLILGIISAVAYAIPIIGMLIAQLIAIPLCAPQGIWMIVWVQVVMFAMARISDNVLVPKIMGQSVGVSPIGAMFAVFAGGELFGIPGLILGIPAAALIKILWRYFMEPWISAQLEKSRLGSCYLLRLGDDADLVFVEDAAARARRAQPFCIGFPRQIVLRDCHQQNSLRVRLRTGGRVRDVERLRARREHVDHAGAQTPAADCGGLRSFDPAIDAGRGAAHA
jgi:predicted PurR-regulated permease PerM